MNCLTPKLRQENKAPGIEAMLLANAIKRIMSADTGDLAERLDAIIALPMLEGQAAMFFALTGWEPRRLLEHLDIDPDEYRRRTCGARHNADGVHGPDCGEAD